MAIPRPCRSWPTSSAPARSPSSSTSAPWKRSASSAATSTRLALWRSSLRSKLPDEDRATKLPLLGNIAAGSPIEAVENREEIDLEKHVPRQERRLRPASVRGDSMIEDHLCDGDYVVIERRENARNGEQVVALLDSGEATLKRFYKEGGNRIRLQPANSTMEPRIVDADRCKIQGVVIGVLRSYTTRNAHKAHEGPRRKSSESNGPGTAPIAAPSFISCRSSCPFVHFVGT